MDSVPHRRQSPRLFLGIEADFVDMAGRQSVLLQDISATGAKIEVRHHHPGASGILSWMQFEVFGDIKWRRGNWCGIVFDRPISNACLVHTRTEAPGVIAEARKNANSHARDFVNGRGI